MKARITRAVVTVCLLALLPGCSFLFVNGPPPDYAERPYFDCTSSRLAPITDTVFAVLYGVSGTVFLTLPTNNGFDSSATMPIGLLYLGWATFLGASAIDGFDDTAACDNATSAMNHRPLVLPVNPGPNNAPAQRPSVWVPAPTASPAPQEAPVLLFAEPPTNTAPPPPSPPPVQSAP